MRACVSVCGGGLVYVCVCVCVWGGGWCVCVGGLGVYMRARTARLGAAAAGGRANANALRKLAALCERGYYAQKFLNPKTLREAFRLEIQTRHWACRILEECWVTDVTSLHQTLRFLGLG